MFINNHARSMAWKDYLW